MNKEKVTIIATIIATFVISVFAFQPTSTEAANNVSPSVMPTPRNRRVKAKKPNQVPKANGLWQLIENVKKRTLGIHEKSIVSINLE